MKTFEGKTILNQKRRPCAKNRQRNIEKLVKVMLDAKSWESLKTFMWICPIPKVNKKFKV